jgi:23S rRNA pseudouridine1911/1915/1917 synthase
MSAMSEIIQLRAEVPYELGGQRLDQIAAQVFPDHSRSRLAGWIKDGRLTVDGAVLRPRDVVHGGSVLTLEAEREAQVEYLAQDIALNVVYEDEHLLVLDKPAGLVVHPAAGHADGTLLNALLHHWPALANVPRGGIVHRLDKDTTGLMVVAKTLEAHTNLVAQLQARSVSRVYEAIVLGVVTAGGKVDAPIGRHSQQRQKMAVTSTGKPAVSHYRVLERFRAHTHVRVKLGLHLCEGSTLIDDQFELKLFQLSLLIISLLSTKIHPNPFIHLTPTSSFAFLARLVLCEGSSS